jgi:hypothetical protein
MLKLSCPHQGPNRSCDACRLAAQSVTKPRRRKQEKPNSFEALAPSWPPNAFCFLCDSRSRRQVHNIAINAVYALYTGNGRLAMP